MYFQIDNNFLNSSILFKNGITKSTYFTSLFKINFLKDNMFVSRDCLLFYKAHIHDNRNNVYSEKYDVIHFIIFINRNQVNILSYICYILIRGNFSWKRIISMKFYYVGKFPNAVNEAINCVKSKNLFL